MRSDRAWEAAHTTLARPCIRQAAAGPSADAPSEGVQFDWYPFVRDGQEFPLPDRGAMESAEIFLEPVDGSSGAVQLTSLGLRPQDVSWSPDGQAILFTADPNVFSEVLYPRTDLFTVDLSGQVS